MLKIVSENFIHALLLFLGLFLKISRWVPLKRLGKIIRENAFKQKKENSGLKFNPLSAQKSGTIEPAVWIAGVHDVATTWRT